MIRDSEIQNYLGYLEKNGNFERLTTNLDNTRAPIHRWFPFLAGFSHKLVTETINYFDLEKKNYCLFDPFIGSGTTGVVAKGLNVDVIGNESNKFLYKICRIKICAPPSIDELATSGEILLKEAKKSWKSTNLTNENPLLEKCYSKNNLKKMIALRDAVNADLDVPLKHNHYLFLALTMSLPKLSNFSINVPYLSWNCKRTPEETFSSFKKSLGIITEDLRKFPYKDNGSSFARIYLQDSRKQNDKIKDSSIDMIFTSPPYLNNLDYGEALKVFLYFWKMVNSWHEITDKIRRPAMVSSTTHYKESALSSKSPEEILGDDFLENFPIISQEIINKVEKIKKVRKLKLPERTKSFDILTALYFKDMSLVLKEMYRVLKNDSLAFLILGDSAPYGIHILTDNLLGEMAVELGFSSFTLKPLRIRGTKWLTLKHRHKRKLRESLLILRR